MDQGDEQGSGLEAADAARAEAEAAVEAASGPESTAQAIGPSVDPPSPDPLSSDPLSSDPLSSDRSGSLDRPDAASPDSEAWPVCPFLRLERDGLLSAAAERPDAEHRCAALEAPVPVSTAQQSLVCLVTTHVDCPRFLRGSQLVPVAEPQRRPAIPRATLAAAVVLGLSLAATLAYTTANGGLSIPVAPASTPGPSAALASTPPPSPSSVPASIATPSPSPSTGTARPSATPSPSPSAGPSSPSSAAGSPTPTGATADRLALLQACPDRPDCYVYIVRTGDNLTSIGLYFGVPFDTLLRLNPWIGDPATIHKGDRIILTTPTR